MDRTVLLEDVDQYEGTTYAQPLSGLRVSWGAILAGALGIVAISLILWALAASITFTATNATMGSVVRTLIALWICAMVTTLIGALAGGWLAGYLPGNRSAVIGGLHGFLAWALAFIVVSASSFGILAGFARTTTQAATTAAAATAQTAGATVGGIAGGQMTLDRKAENLLESLGYAPSEARSMVEQGKARIQSELRGTRNMPSAVPAARGALDTLLDWTAGLTWSWFGTWIVSAALAMAAGVGGAKAVRRRVVPTARPVTEPPITAAPQPA